MQSDKLMFSGLITTSQKSLPFEGKVDPKGTDELVNAEFRQAEFNLLSYLCLG
jgi:hypothetical protein